MGGDSWELDELEVLACCLFLLLCDVSGTASTEAGVSCLLCMPFCNMRYHMFLSDTKI